MGKLIAVTGKGGVGKTTISALLVRHLVKRGNTPILVVDADPNSNLNEVLGLSVDETIGSIREEMAQRVGELPGGMAKHDFLEMKVQECLVEASGFDLVVMGRPEGPGCYCFANNVLRDVLKMLGKQYPNIVVDNEAGMEHLSRRITTSIDHLLIVSDASIRGMLAAERIRELVDELKLTIGTMHLLINRVHDGLSAEVEKRVKTFGAPLIAAIPDDGIVREFDGSGRPLIELPDSSGTVRMVSEIADRLKI
ncbi:MAG: carbon monoxide dehydrogenase [Candidatus Abyssobacteria bacterium SURF_17]|uniref:Carbon monoxide dehydrogenase n=1 Tax=Candidatus Abyssobacteria bacterium SURF_17 TaxID=2093361 RepID=A0A419ESC1_9BACT|nr:MAG: carbon monoxide dehydrogenase [Candidatus Abyssubacteria bacterium SURF_17]